MVEWGNVLRHCFYPAAHDLTQLDPCNLFVMPIEAELQVVGDDQVFQGLSIALKLLPVLFVVEISSHILGFDVSQRDLAMANDKIGRSALDACRFVGDVDNACRSQPFH